MYSHTCWLQIPLARSWCVRAACDALGRVPWPLMKRLCCPRSQALKAETLQRQHDVLLDDLRRVKLSQELSVSLSSLDVSLSDIGPELSAALAARASQGTGNATPVADKRPDLEAVKRGLTHSSAAASVLVREHAMRTVLGGSCVVTVVSSLHAVRLGAQERYRRCRLHYYILRASWGLSWQPQRQRSTCGPRGALAAHTQTEPQWP